MLYTVEHRLHQLRRRPPRQQGRRRSSRSQTASVKQVPGSAEYALAVATTGDPATGPLVFLLTDPATGAVSAGDAAGLRPLDPATSPSARPARSPRRRRLHRAQRRPGQRRAARRSPTWPCRPPGGAIRSTGLTRAVRGQGRSGRTTRGCDCVTDATTGKTWTADDGRAPSSPPTGERLAQGWKVGVGLANFTRVLTDPTISGPFLGMLDLELRLRARLRRRPRSRSACSCALALHSPRMRGTQPLPGAADPAVRHAVVRDAAGLAGHVQHRLRADQQAASGSTSTGSGGPWTARLAVHPGAALAGLPVHVPGGHRRAAGHPAGADRGRRGRRGVTAGRRSGGSPCRCCWSRCRRC